MENTSIDITDKLPASLVELYSSAAFHAGSLGIEYLVVGAMARDLVLVHGFGSKIERGTKDVDFAINVSFWKEFDSLRDALLRSGYQADKKAVHKFHYKCSGDLPWEIDIVPFGAIADEKSTIAWPPDQDFEMNVLGFKEAAQGALNVRISRNPEVVVNVASPAGMSMLKLISWIDRDPNKRKKDAADIRYLIESYTKIPAIRDAVYEGGQMAEQEFDLERAGAMKLGFDAANIASNETKTFIKEKLFDDEEWFEILIREMAENSPSSLDECKNWITIFKEEFTRRLPEQ